MTDESSNPAEHPADATILAVADWLAAIGAGNDPVDHGELLHQLVALRDSTAPDSIRKHLFDRLHAQAGRLVLGEIANLREISLPVSRGLRQRANLIQEALDLLINAHLDFVSGSPGPSGAQPNRSPLATLHRLLQCIGWHVLISQFLAAPQSPGIWRQLHAAYLAARRLGLANTPSGPSGSTIEHAYTRILLAAIAQPASFSAVELAFIADYIGRCITPVDILESPPSDRKGVFWIDPGKDFPAQAMLRRKPASDVSGLYFACDLVARDVRNHLAELARGRPATSLGIPELADSQAGLGVLRRLANLWGNPSARKFTRRHRSYRVHLYAGLQQVWALLRHNPDRAQLSEWMVTNESPDGYALMHIAGATDHLHVGDLVAIQLVEDHHDQAPSWHIGIVRWAISENQAHIELGIEQLAAAAIAAEVIAAPSSGAVTVPALLLPEAPSVRASPLLIGKAGSFSSREGQLILLGDDGTVIINTVRLGALVDQTLRIELFSAVPSERLSPQSSPQTGSPPS